MVVESLLGSAVTPEELAEYPPLPLFSEQALAFVGALSTALMRDTEARGFPELTALAFWMRRSNLNRLRDSLLQRAGDALLAPRGTALHFAPSNVDTIFVYSWFLSLLAGNRNIIRVSRTTSPQMEVLLRLIAELVGDQQHSEVGQRSVVLRYAPNDQVTADLSELCDVRVIWGGDETVRDIRRLPLKPTACELAFANKVSLAAIDCPAWLNADEAQKSSWAEAFFNDAYWFDQMACSSPRYVLWVGDSESARQAAADFWPRVEAILRQRQQRLADADYVNKRVAEDSMAIGSDVTLPMTSNNDLVRVWLETPALDFSHHCGAGLFYEMVLPALEDLRPMVDRSIQTLAYAGFPREQLQAFVASAPLAGIDRIVPFGKALEFSPVWDGYDLLRSFTREITIS